MCELQVLDSEHPQYAQLDDRQYHGSAYGMVPAARGYLRPTGEWNFQQVTVVGSRIRVELNGYLILDADLAGVTDFMGAIRIRARTAREGISASPVTPIRSSSARSRSNDSIDHPDRLAWSHLQKNPPVFPTSTPPCRVLASGQASWYSATTLEPARAATTCSRIRNGHGPISPSGPPCGAVKGCTQAARDESCWC